VQELSCGGNYLCKANRMSSAPGQADAGSRRAQRDAVAAALQQHQRWLRTVLAARGVDRTALDDALQSVCTAAIAGAQRLNDCDRVAPWLYRIAVVEALQYRRRTGRRRRISLRYAASGMAPSELANHDPLAWLLAEETKKLVRQAISRLPAKDAEMLLLKYTEDWSYRDIAERVGISVSAVETRLHRARGRLRAELSRLAPELALQS
jgi:RNA polymerase sigma-70 factor (ECF subfamily)